MSQDEMQAKLDVKAAKAPVAQGAILRFPRAMAAVARVSHDGAIKYNVPTNDLGYLDIPDADFVYRDALGRHLVAEVLEGPINPEDGGHLHAAHIAWNALARLEWLLREREVENTIREDLHVLADEYQHDPLSTLHRTEDFGVTVTPFTAPLPTETPKRRAPPWVSDTDL